MIMRDESTIGVVESTRRGIVYARHGGAMREGEYYAAGDSLLLCTDPHAAAASGEYVAALVPVRGRPPLPGDPVRPAEPADAAAPCAGRCIFIGWASGAPVLVDWGAVETRHLAVFAVTGAGKSNAVKVMVEEATRVHGSTVIVLDFHGEYGGFTREARVPAKVNPLHLGFHALAELAGVEHQYYKQASMLRLVFERCRGSITCMVEALRAAAEEMRGDAAATAHRLALRLENVAEEYGDVLDSDAPPPHEAVAEGHVNVVDMSGLDDVAADLVASYFLSGLLRAARTGDAPTPAVIVFEEAHILLSGDTLSRRWAARVAREGRKFALGLTVVSQRPRWLDKNIVSQLNSRLILRIIDESDLNYIRESSDVHPALIELLPGLETGEAIAAGEWLANPMKIRIRAFSA